MPEPTHTWDFYPLHVKFEESEILEVEYLMCGEPDKNKRRFCKTCLDEGHQYIQGDGMDVHDCKAVFYDKDKKQRGQCCCYSWEHGTRKKRY